MVESVSKTKVTRADLEGVVARWFGTTARLRSYTPCDDGWFSAVHRLGLDDGSEYIIKIAPPAGVAVLRHEHDLMAGEVEVLRLVGELTGLPVPMVLAWDESLDLLASPYYLMDVCQGESLARIGPSLDAHARARVDAELMRHLTALHSVTGPAFGRPGRSGVRGGAWREVFGRLVGDVLADADDANVLLPVAGPDLLAPVGESKGALDEVTTPRLIHGDLWDTNVFVDPDTLEVVGLIDFERAIWADPLMEAQFVGRRRGDGTVAAYGSPLWDAPGAVARRRLYDLHLHLVMLVECAYRHFPEESERTATARLLGVVDEIALA